MTIAANILIATGILLMAVSALALFTMPDLYTRAHAVAKSETIGMTLVFLGVLLRPEVDLGAGGRLAFIIIFATIANPTGVHALVRAAYRTGARPRIDLDQAGADRQLGGTRS